MKSRAQFRKGCARTLVLKILSERPMYGLVRFKVTNESPVTIDGIQLQTDLPAELTYHAGRELEHDIDTLAPGQSHKATLMVRGLTLGTATHAAKVLVGGNTIDEAAVRIEVVRPGGAGNSSASGKRGRGELGVASGTGAPRGYPAARGTRRHNLAIIPLPQRSQLARHRDSAPHALLAGNSRLPRLALPQRIVGRHIESGLLESGLPESRLLEPRLLPDFVRLTSSVS